MRNSHFADIRPEVSSSKTLQIFAFLAVYLIWGSTYLAILYSLESFPPFLMLGVRFSIAGSILYGYMRWKGTPPPSADQIRSATVLGVMMLLIGTGGIAWSEKHIPSGLAALLVATVPLWIILLEWIWLKGDRPRGRVFFAAILGLAGVSMVVQRPDTVGNGIQYFLAIGISLLAALSWSVGSLLGRRMDLPENPFMVAALQMTFGGVALIIFGTLLGEYKGFLFSQVSLTSSIAVLYLLVFGSFIAFTAFVWLLKHVPPSRVATYAFVNPIVAVLLGTFIAGEVISLRIGIAGALLVGSVVIIIWSARPIPSKRILSKRSNRLQNHIRNRREELQMTLTTTDRYSQLRAKIRNSGISKARHKSLSQ